MTFRRPQVLAAMLDALARQTVPLDRLVIVDNAPSADSRAVAEAYSDGPTKIDYHPTDRNLGSAGGVAAGLDIVMGDPDVADDDWVLLLDDDDPPFSDDLTAELIRFATGLDDNRLGVVGVVGSRFDLRTAHSLRLPDAELSGPVSVDWIGQNQFPLIRVGAARGTGRYGGDLFFGHHELEYGLRLRAAGWRLYAHGDLWWSRRESEGRLGLDIGPTLALGPVSWRRYYRLRNLIWILRSHGRDLAAARVVVIRGILKPLAGLRRPRLALGHLRMNMRAARDGWAGRLGPRQEPETRPGPKPSPDTQPL